MSKEHYMQIALELARRGLGRTWPNPAVGCVVVKNGVIIARARTANSGRPHAETECLKFAGKEAEGATAYVTLEPCSHHGKTPPCAEKLAEAGIAEVVIGCIDPDKRVSGSGIKILEKAGIKVTSGVMAKECEELNKGFFTLIKKQRPYIMLKAAISADGKYLAGTGEPRWVTGEMARSKVHLLRSQYDAIITGTGTILADNPRLDCRLPGMENLSPIKVVIGHRKIPETANIFQGNEVLLYKDNAIRHLAEKGITRAMVEAGSTLSNAFLKNGLVDEIIIFQSPETLGKSGQVFFNAKLLENFQKISEHQLAEDKMLILKPINHN